ncbi:MAG: hypothetical protein KC983_01870 [Phycisphaerales bacterium]|nr:hypothetical protein [Phycisphaerales bacterium]
MQVFTHGSIRNGWLVASVLGVSALTAPVTAGIVLPTSIDDFTDTNSPDFPLVVAAGITPTDSAVETGLSGVLGGARTTTLSLDGGSGLAAGFVDNSNMIFELSSSLNTTAFLSFDYGAAAGASDLNANFLNAVGIEISIAGFDYASDAPLDVMVTLMSNGVERTANVAVTSVGAQSVMLDFGSFSSMGGGGGAFSFGDIDRIGVQFPFQGGADFEIGSIQTAIPGPGVCVALAVAGLTGGRRRRRV